jgi:hypothetical protein
MWKGPVPDTNPQTQAQIDLLFETESILTVYTQEIQKRFSWQRPTLPGTPVPSTIGAGGLNYLVRYGAGCFPSAKATRRTFYAIGSGSDTLKTEQDAWSEREFTLVN